MHDSTVLARFTALADRDGPLPTWMPFLGVCWRWQGKISDHGYGRLWVNGDNIYTHRLSYQLFVGPIPAGLVIDHLCRNRFCCNPGHMEPITRTENFQRGFLAVTIDRLTHCGKGHEWTEENTWRSPSRKGYRRCRRCDFMRRHPNS